MERTFTVLSYMVCPSSNKITTTIIKYKGNWQSQKSRGVIWLYGPLSTAALTESDLIVVFGDIDAFLNWRNFATFAFCEK